MAVELCPENTTVSWQSAAIGSPRMSFSRDLLGHESGGGEHERLDGSLIPGSPATSDFDFCVAGEGYDQEPSAADELFSDGKILPIPIQSRGQTIPISKAINYVHPPQTPPDEAMRTEPVPGKQTIGCGDDDGEPDKPRPVTWKPSTSFWKFGRSNSLNCSGGGGGGNSTGRSHMANFICSVALLTKSKSTGSSNLNLNPNPERRHQKQQPRRTTSRRSSTWKVSRTNSNSSSSSSSSSLNSSYYYGSFDSANNGVRISPVLNVPHPCIRKGGGNGFYGLGRLLCSRKKRSSSKQMSLSSPP